MQKMPAGFNAESGDWRYSMVMPNGSVFGTTGGASGVQFCIGFLASAEEQDSMYFLPDEDRVNQVGSPAAAPPRGDAAARSG